MSEESPLFAVLAVLARDARLVFFAGLPGTGKSLLIHQLAHLAHARERHRLRDGGGEGRARGDQNRVARER